MNEQNNTRWVRSIEDEVWLDIKVVATEQRMTVGEYLTYLHNKYKAELKAEYLELQR